MSQILLSGMHFEEGLSYFPKTITFTRFIDQLNHTIIKELLNYSKFIHRIDFMIKNTQGWVLRDRRLLWNFELYKT